MREQSGPFVWVVESSDGPNAACVLFQNERVIALVHFLNKHHSELVLVCCFVKYYVLEACSCNLLSVSFVLKLPMVFYNSAQLDCSCKCHLVVDFFAGGDVE